MNTNQKGSTNKEWYNEECRNAKTKLSKLFKKYKKLETNESLLEYKKYATFYKKLLKSAKVEYDKKFHTELRSLKANNSKKYWKILKEYNNVILEWVIYLKMNLCSTLKSLMNLEIRKLQTLILD